MNRVPPSGSAAETNTNCQIKSELIQFMTRLDHAIGGLQPLEQRVSQSAAEPARRVGGDHPATLGRGTLGAYIRRQSSPSNDHPQRYPYC